MTQQQDQKEPCGLCGAEAVLEVSHMVPRFVANRMRKESPTGFFRDGNNVDVRVQDAPKERMLCRACENLFSDLEARFAPDVFTPTMDGASLDIEITEEHHRFCASVVWRNLKRVLRRREDLADEYSEDDWSAIERSEHDLRKYLLRQAAAPADPQLHLFSARSVTEAQIPGLNAFFNLTLGALLCGREDAPARLYSITPMNGLMLIGLVNSDEECRQEWSDGKMLIERGRRWSNHDQLLNDPYFAGLLMRRAKDQLAAFEAMSDKQKGVVDKAMKRADLEKWLNQPHGQAVMQDFINRHRGEK